MGEFLDSYFYHATEFSLIHFCGSAFALQICFSGSGSTSTIFSHNQILSALTDGQTP